MSDEAPETEPADEPSPAAAGSPAPSPAATPAASGDPVEDAWAAVLARWDSAEAHKKFLVLCDTMDRLGEAGRRYREIRDGDPSRRAEAEKRIDDLLGFAMARVRVDKVEPAKTRSRIEWIALGVSIVLVSAAVISMLRMFGQ